MAFRSARDSRTRGDRRWLWRASAAVLAAALVGVPAAGASAAEPSNWWYDVYHVAQVHQEGFTGKGVKVAVIDGQINPSLPTFDGVNLTVSPKPFCANPSASPSTSQANAGSLHGTTVTALIVGNGTGPAQVQGMAPAADVTFYGMGIDFKSCEQPTAANGVGSVDVIGAAIDAAVASGAKIISISMGGPETAAQTKAVTRALAAGVIIVAGQPNSFDQGLQTTGFPGIYDGVVTVNAVDSNGSLEVVDGRPNVQPDTTVVGAGVGMPWVDWSQGADTGDALGSSLATPLVAGMLAAAWQAHPKATADQMIQSLIHTTGGTPHAQVPYDEANGMGYGAASLTGMLKDDPLKYPNVNPLMDKAHNLGAGPTQAQVDAARAKLSPHAGASASAHAVAAPARAGSGILMPLLVTAIVVGILVLLGLGLLVVVLARRAKRGTVVVPRSDSSPTGGSI